MGRRPVAGPGPRSCQCRVKWPRILPFTPSGLSWPRSRILPFFFFFFFFFFFPHQTPVSFLDKVVPTRAFRRRVPSTPPAAIFSKERHVFYSRFIPRQPGPRFHPARESRLPSARRVRQQGPYQASKSTKPFTNSPMKTLRKDSGPASREDLHWFKPWDKVLAWNLPWAKLVRRQQNQSQL